MAPTKPISPAHTFAAAATELLLSLTALGLDAPGVVDEGELEALALFSGAEKADELVSASGVLVVASVVLDFSVLSSVELASAVLVVISGAALSVLASAVLVAVVVSVTAPSVLVVSLMVEEATKDVSAEEAVPAESMGNWIV